MGILPAQNSQLRREETPGTIKFKRGLEKNPWSLQENGITAVSATLFNIKNNNILHLAGNSPGTGKTFVRD